LLLGPLLGVLLLSAPLGTRTPSALPAPTPAAIEVAAIGRDCPAEDFPCVIMAWSAAVDEAGVPMVVDEFERRMRDEIAFRDGCHAIAHAVGSGAYDLLGDSVAALLVGSESCAGGFSHAVLIRELMDAPRDALPELVERGLRVCSDPQITTDGVLIGECAHGIGHALVVRLSDITAAMTGCGTIGRDPLYDWLSILCVDGAIMESFEPTDNVRRSIVAEGSDPVTPCFALERSEHQGRCVHYAIRRLPGGDVRAQLVRCEGLLDPIVRDDCVSGSISQAATESNADQREIATLCAATRDPARCVGYAATAIGYLYERLAPEAETLCGAPGVDAARCISEAVRQVRDLAGSTAAVDACTALGLPAAARTACLRIANE